MQDLVVEICGTWIFFCGDPRHDEKLETIPIAHCTIFSFFLADLGLKYDNMEKYNQAFERKLGLMITREKIRVDYNPREN